MLVLVVEEVGVVEMLAMLVVLMVVAQVLMVVNSEKEVTLLHLLRIKTPQLQLLRQLHPVRMPLRLWAARLSLRAFTFSSLLPSPGC